MGLIFEKKLFHFLVSSTLSLDRETGGKARKGEEEGKNWVWNWVIGGSTVFATLNVVL